MSSYRDKGLNYIKSVRGSRVVPCEHTDLHSNMTKLRVAFRNFANAAKTPWRNVLVCKHLGQH